MGASKMICDVAGGKEGRRDVSLRFELWTYQHRFRFMFLGIHPDCRILLIKELVIVFEVSIIIIIIGVVILGDSKV